MPQGPEPDVKLAETLSSLIERGGYSRNRQKILDAVGISAAALSQYTRGQTKPSFDRLVALARFFDVSLDYLVYGRRTAPSVETGPVPAMIELALADARARTSRHAAIVRRITRVLADRVDGVARELADAPNAAREGLLQDDELLRVERYARHVDVLSPALDFDVVVGPQGVVTPGAFLHLVADNLSRDCSYRFLTSSDAAGEGVVSAVTSLRDVLVEQVGGDGVSALCEFRETSVPILVSVCLLEIDSASFAAEEPALFEQLELHLGAEGHLGYVIRPNVESNADMVMSRLHRERARAAFESTWRAARSAA